MDTLGLSTTQISMESLRVFISVMRWESLASAKSSAGFKTMTTAAAKTAKIAITIKSSTKVKEGVDLRHKGSPPPAGPPKAEMAIAIKSSTRVKEGAEWNEVPVWNKVKKFVLRNLGMFLNYIIPIIIP